MWCFFLFFFNPLFIRWLLIAETDSVIIQTVQVLQGKKKKKKLKSNDGMNFLADLNTTRSGAAHDESPPVTAAVKLKRGEEEESKNDLLFSFFFFSSF